MSKLSSTVGYLIHQHPFQNSSLILHLYTKDYGKIHILAKGIKKNKKQKSELLPFQQLKIEFINSESLGKLRSLEVEETGAITELLHKTVGMYFNELIYKAFTDKEPSLKFYSYYKNTVKKLSKSSQLHSSFLRKFELTLLESCGFALEIDSTWQKDDYLLIDENLGVTTTPLKNKGVCKVSDLEFILIGKPIESQSKKQVADLIYQAINLCVNYKPIKSRELIQLIWKK